MNMRGPYIHGGYKSVFFKYSCDAMSQEIPIHADNPRFFPRRILVVEDNPLFEQVIGQAIESLGIDGKTYFCQTGSQALNLLLPNFTVGGIPLALSGMGELMPGSYPVPQNPLRITAPVPTQARVTMNGLTRSFGVAL